MIAKLTGTIDFIGAESIILDVNGVGYLVFCTSRTLGRLTKGTIISLYTETVVREDSITIYGFADMLEKEWFLTLTKVQGVGSKVGLSILSSASCTELSQALVVQDKNIFARANGVGPKLAQRIVTELKDKIVQLPLGAQKSDLGNALNIGTTDSLSAPIPEETYSDPTAMEDAISALVNLGYQKIEAYRAVNLAAKNNPQADMQELIKQALKEFVKKEF